LSLEQSKLLLSAIEHHQSADLLVYTFGKVADHKLDEQFLAAHLGLKEKVGQAYR
jgi:hypothetical protein